jgi:hypothetical protein
VSRAFEERGSLSDRTWEQIQALLGPGVSRPGEQAKGQGKEDQVTDTGEEEGAKEPAQSTSRSGRVQKMSTRKAEQVESEAIQKGGRNLRKR